MHLLIPRINFDCSVVNTNEKKYFFEICLLTKNNNEKRLREWLDWHITKIKVDHIYIYDNESSFSFDGILHDYGNIVSYEKVLGKAHQAEIYTNHVQKISNAQYVLPIDDDEYLYSYFNLIQYLRRMQPVKLPITEMLFAPGEPMEYKSDLPVIETNDHIVYKNLLRENLEVKTIVNTSYNHTYVDLEKYTRENPSEHGHDGPQWNDWQISPDSNYEPDERGETFDYNIIGNVHNPITMINEEIVHANDYYGRPVYGYMAASNGVPGELFIAHMKIVSKEEWDYKCRVRGVVADMKSNYYDNQYKLYSLVYGNTAIRQKCDFLQKL